ncbi:MAG TPA: 50S ribosomal protein L19 [Patescibacteria group bacterium]
MALIGTVKETSFGVGDTVKVHLKVKEGEKTRNQIFEGMVIGIKGKDQGRTFLVRKIGAQKVGIEMIFPFNTPTLEKVEVVRKGTEGVKQAKLYYTRGQSTREIEKIYSRASRKNKQEVSKKKIVKKTVKKTKKTSRK